MCISLVVATARNGVIGSKGKMPWHLPADLKHFKNVTWGLPIIMGRKTFESLGKPLPGRQNIVITRQPNFKPQGVDVVESPEHALVVARSAESKEVCVIGGGEIYQVFFPLADRIYLTRVQADVEGDTFFSAVDPEQWKLTSQRHHPADEKNAMDLVYEQWDRIGKSPA
ncbi:MAG: dihydrofolate reductase [Bacteroidetes bacterium]|nr:dihydrofolate reductase [Bacteroidota bacterium]